MTRSARITITTAAASIFLAALGWLVMHRMTEPPPPRYASLTARDEEVIAFIIRSYSPPGDRIYFLTVTPMDKWGEKGDWETVPQEFQNRVAPYYRPANQAILKEGRVLEFGSKNEAWMQWITIKRWISETEVEVEKGAWCCPLGGGAHSYIYEKVNGEWRIKESLGGWVS